LPQAWALVHPGERERDALAKRDYLIARMTTNVGAESSHAEEALAWVQRTMVPAMRDQPGFDRAITLLDRERGKAIEIGFWDGTASLSVHSRHTSRPRRRRHDNRLEAAVDRHCDVRRLVCAGGAADRAR
jgi:hypothetical protein